MNDGAELRTSSDNSSTSGSSERLVVLIVAGIIAVVAYFALGMPGMDHGAEIENHPSQDHQP